MKQIIKSLLNAQREIKNAQKDASNPFHKSKYASLESVIEAVKLHANNNEIVITQVNGKDEKGYFVKTILMHTSGETLESIVYLQLEKSTSQAFGSAVSYARRYDLASIFCITQSDDDGNEEEKTLKLDSIKDIILKRAEKNNIDKVKLNEIVSKFLLTKNKTLEQINQSDLDALLTKMEEK